MSRDALFSHLGRNRLTSPAKSYANKKLTRWMQPENSNTPMDSLVITHRFKPWNKWWKRILQTVGAEHLWAIISRRREPSSPKGKLSPQHSTLNTVRNKWCNFRIHIWPIQPLDTLAEGRNTIRLKGPIRWHKPRKPDWRWWWFQHGHIHRYAGSIHCKEIEINDLHGRSLLQEIQSSLMTDRKASMCQSPDQEKCYLFICGYSFRGRYRHDRDADEVLLPKYENVRRN